MLFIGAKYDPEDSSRLLVDYRLCSVLIPTCLVGTAIGVHLSYYLPAILVFGMQIVILSLLALSVYIRGKYFSANKEKKQTSPASSQEDKKPRIFGPKRVKTKPSSERSFVSPFWPSWAESGRRGNDRVQQALERGLFELPKRRVRLHAESYHFALRQIHRNDKLVGQAEGNMQASRKRRKRSDNGVETDSG